LLFALALFALSKMMTGCPQQRLQIFVVDHSSLCHSERSRGISCFKISGVARDYNFWIYIVTNRNHSVVYIAVTNRLSRRIREHREGVGSGFAADYHCTKFVYYEWYTDIRDAIARESQLKKSSHAKKVGLINRLNPQLARLGCGRATGQITSRDFSTFARNDN
jgi:putative endonuclease